MPRPTRCRGLRAPAGALIEFSRIMASQSVVDPASADLQQVGDLVDHAAHSRCVLELARLVDPFQTQAQNRGPVVGAGTRNALDQRHRHRFFRHFAPPVMSSTDLPRLAAISAGVRNSCSAFRVARTMLYGLVDPCDLATTLRTPMRPSPSPTTVSAAKPRMRPPLTTLVTRLTAIIFSRKPSSRASPRLFGWILAIVVLRFSARPRAPHRQAP